MNLKILNNFVFPLFIFQQKTLSHTFRPKPPITLVKSQIVQQPQEQVGDLIFDANFESGNLYKAYYQRENEYDLWLGADLGMDNQRQWFFFQVRNMTPNVPYKFNILNNEKKESQFGKGMQPLVYSMREAIQGNPAWRRSGKNIVYIKNNYKNRLGKSIFSL